MTRTLTTQDISWFLDLNEKGQLDLDPPYQRRSVWSPKDKRYFIDTILNGYPAPPVFLHKTLDENGRATYHVVDGKQRLQTIIDFTGDKIRVPQDFGDVTISNKRWSELGREYKERFWNYTLIAEMLPNVDSEVIRNTFERINRNSRKLTAQEMRHARYEGWFIQTVETESKSEEWIKFGVVTVAKAKRMSDVQFLSELFAVVIYERINGFDQDALDSLYAELEDIDTADYVEETILDEVERAKNLVNQIVEAQPEVLEFLKVQKHFYSLWCFLVLETDWLSIPDFFPGKYFEFMEKVREFRPGAEVDDGEIDKSVLDYASASTGANTDITPRTNRHEALKNELVD